MVFKTNLRICVLIEYEFVKGRKKERKNRTTPLLRCLGLSRLSVVLLVCDSVAMPFRCA